VSVCLCLCVCVSVYLENGLVLLLEPSTDVPVLWVCVCVCGGVCVCVSVPGEGFGPAAGAQHRCPSRPQLTLSQPVGWRQLQVRLCVCVNVHVCCKWELVKRNTRQH